MAHFARASSARAAHTNGTANRGGGGGLVGEGWGTGSTGASGSSGIVILVFG